MKTNGFYRSAKSESSSVNVANNVSLNSSLGHNESDLDFLDDAVSNVHNLTDELKELQCVP